MRKISALIVALIAVCGIRAQQTVTYNIPFSQTIGLQQTSGDICSAPFTIEEAFQITQGNTWGCTWTSTNTGTVTSVEITVGFTVTDGGGNFPTTLNGSASFNVTDGGAKNCEPSTMLTWNVDPTNYIAGGVNTFLVDFATAANVSQVDNLPFEIDSYMYITVVYDTCGVIDTTVTQNGDTLTSNASNATYQWIDCATGNDIVGETGASYIVTSTGEYGVIITNNASGCSDTSVCTQVTVSGTGIPELPGGNLHLYPNPTPDLISIDLTAFSGSTVISIYDMQGRVVLTQNVGASVNGSVIMDLNGLSPGQYQVRVVSDDRIATARLVKE